MFLDGHHDTFSEFWDTHPVFYQCLVASVLLPVLTLSLSWFWSLNNWSNHPMVTKLRMYARDGEC